MLNLSASELQGKTSHYIDSGPQSGLIILARGWDAWPGTGQGVLRRGERLGSAGGGICSGG